MSPVNHNLTKYQVPKNPTQIAPTQTITFPQSHPHQSPIPTLQFPNPNKQPPKRIFPDFPIPIPWVCCCPWLTNSIGVWIGGYVMWLGMCVCVLFVPDIVIRACDVEGDLHNVKRGGEGGINEWIGLLHNFLGLFFVLGLGVSFFMPFFFLSFSFRFFAWVALRWEFISRVVVVIVMIIVVIVFLRGNNVSNIF